MSVFSARTPTHAELCALAVRWLRRPNSAGGHGCIVSVSEPRADYSGEVPDAIGFRAGWQAGSVVVECKTTRSDFLADRTKPHRQPACGMGTWRYFLAPAGLISADELPDRWGLLEVGARNSISCRVGGMVECRNFILRSDNLAAFRHESDLARERDLLTRLLARVGDAEKLNGQIREARGAARHAAEQVERERKINSALRRELLGAKLALGGAGGVPAGAEPERQPAAGGSFE